MKLITEEINDVHFITEEKNGKKELYIEGVFLQSEVKNRNGRVYPYPILEREVSRYNDNYVNKNRAFGELGHPDSPTINLDRVSHMITQLRPDGKNFIGKAKILDTPNGRIVKSLLEGGASLGVSTRGVGSLKPQNGYQLVQDDFHLATAADIVADPSAPDAFVRALSENAEWILTDTGWKEVDYEKAKKQLKEASKADIETVALRVFENFMSKLTKI
jgi:Prohead core protein serine protease